MEDLQLIQQKLKKLKLSGVAVALEEKLRQAGSQKWSCWVGGDAHLRACLRPPLKLYVQFSRIQLS